MKHRYNRKNVLRLLAIVALMAVSQSFIHAEVTHFSVILKNGAHTGFRLEDRPEITFAGNTCTIKSPTFSQDYDMSEIEHIRFDDDLVTSIVSPVSKDVKIDLSDRTQIVVRGLAPDLTVRLYSVNGLSLMSANADSDGMVRIHLDELPSNAIYIVNISRLKTFKIYR